MAFPSAPSALWSVSVLTVLFTAAVHSNIVYDDDPLQPVTSDETVSVGGTVTLTCRVAESDNSSLQWSNTAQQTLYFGEKRALRDNRIQLHRSTSTELSITIADVQLSDEGEYTCSIFTMPVRTARATVTVLGVPGKPQISGFENAVPEGGKVTLTCISTGSKPPARLIWYRGDQELEGRLDVVEPVPDDPTYNVSSELTLEVSRSDDNALITCAVDHPSLAPGDKRSEQALRVLYSPEVVISPENNLPREGEKFFLQCLGNGNPEPTTYMWEKKDGELPPLAKVDGAFLRFEMLNKSDNGVYLCQVDNGIGNNQGEYTLLVQDPMDPDAVDTTSPSPDFSTSTSSLPSSSPPDTFSGSGSDSAYSSSSSSPPDLTSTSFPDSSPSANPSNADMSTTVSDSYTTTTILSNALFPDLPFSHSPSSPAATPPSSASSAPSTATPTYPSLASSLTPSVSVRLNGVYTFTDAAENIADPTAMLTSSGVDHAVIGGVVAVIVFILLCLLIVLGRYLIRHKGTYLTHEAKGSDDAPDADTAIINAEGGHSGAEDKKEYFI
ncbi:cell adhesion molecule 3 isoform X2 [Seriola lalandi dorsalis]|uniref:cell adhesion molecule 3 isoform X2 n=1 Tax=Seriola lalandi dorsalis TaxID=1841481 RepID=UPI000C6FBC68|nr:cell adhesion molecule 3 isoform X2 [Seriola lalandi dorsalis]